MRKNIAVLAVVLGVAFATGCEADFSGQDPDGYVEEIVKDVKAQAEEELKKAFAKEVSDFFESTDLTETLGISGEEREQLEESLRKYIDEYSADEQKLGEAKEAIEQLFENADHLTAEELENNIKEIFEKK